MSSYFTLVCLEWACFVFKAADIYACPNLSRQILPSSEPRCLNLGCKNGEANKGHIQNIENVVLPGSVHLETN